MEDIYNRFKIYILANNLIIPGEKILLSLSAGKDSMFMLDLMKKFQNDLSFEIGVFHLNHLTRGEETDKDEIFVREKSDECNIPCYIERFDFKKNKAQHISFEEQARNIRYSFLNKISETEGFSKIAVAHNFNDNAETVLMRMLSGTGISGIKGIRPVVKNIIRPVLFAEKNEIYSYLKNNNIEWREDASNSENLYLRNYLRNIIIPSIEARFPRVEENLFNLANHAAENQSLISDLVNRLYPDVVTGNESETIIDVNSFSKDISLIKFFISGVLYDIYGIKMKISLYNEIVRRYLINSANMVLYEKDNLTIRKCFLNDKVIISINSNINPEGVGPWEYVLSLEENSVIFLNEINKELKVSSVSYDFYSANKNRFDIIFIQPENDVRKIVLRNRRPGDRIKTECGTKKIKELMIEKKLDSRVKNNIPLIVVDDYVAAYLPGLVNSNNNRVSCNFQIKNNTKRILAFYFADYLL